MIYTIIFDQKYVSFIKSFKNTYFYQVKVGHIFKLNNIYRHGSSKKQVSAIHLTLHLLVFTTAMAMCNKYLIH
jgi:hypothetical protein